MKCNLINYEDPKVYLRNGKKCVFDPIRQILVPQTPEEIVRQKIIQFLQIEMGVPKEMIEVEVPMVRFKKGERGRADIIVYGKKDDSLEVPNLVIECKAPEVCLTDDVYIQVDNYNQILYADTMMVTNGSEMIFLSWNYEREEYLELLEVPSYKMLLTKQSLKYDLSEPIIWKKPNFTEINSYKVINQFKSYGIIGEDTRESLYPYIINLASFFFDESDKLSPQIIAGINILEDGGLRYAAFGNAAGGSWVGDYRFFVIEDSHKNNQIISFSVMGMEKRKGDPRFGNTKGSTTLVVAIDDFEKRHNSLQLNLDKYIDVDDDSFTIWHDGTLTAGNHGRVKRDLVVEFVYRNAPELIDDYTGRIILGKLSNRNEISWDRPEAKTFIGRLIKYAILRDQFRKLFIN